MRLRPCPCGRAVRGLTEEGGVCIYLSLVPRGKVFTAHGNASMSVRLSRFAWPKRRGRAPVLVHVPAVNKR
jgi:hypothetical protein